jgi:hypothetical protein
LLNLNRLKLIDLPHRYNNTARLNLKIDRFQVNNEYSRWDAIHDSAVGLNV